jgi:recombination protein RecA
MIQKKYGKIIESGNLVLEQLNELSVLSISPAIDLALGGGFREGQIVILGGDPKTGKTTTALYAAAKAQAAGKKVYYINTEGRLTKHNFTGIKGLDIQAIEIVQSTEDQPMVSAETYLNVMERLIKEEENLFFICDSTSNMVPQDELDGEIRTGVRNALPRLLSMFFKRTSGDVTRMKAIGVFILHNIANTGGSRFSPSKMQDCGNMIQFQAGTNMVITHRGKWEVPKESGNHIGQIANWKVMTSAAGGTPLTQFQSWIRYGVGLDESQELAQIASEFALIDKKGAWYTLSSLIEDKDEPVIKKWLKSHPDADTEEKITKLLKFQGMEKVTNFLDENEELREHLYGQVREMFE